MVCSKNLFLIQHNRFLVCYRFLNSVRAIVVSSDTVVYSLYKPSFAVISRCIRAGQTSRNF